MNYYYDIVLNFQDIFYMFYEWESDDEFCFFKKIPIIHIDNDTYIDFVTKKVKVNSEFLEEIEDKSKLKDGSSIKYACIFSDGKNSIAILFNEMGESISKSSIELDDEININEFMYSILEIKVKYEILDNEPFRKNLRKEEKIKRLLKVEINTLYNNKEYSKFKYIYLEWFNIYSDDYKKMYMDMCNKLDDKLTDKEYEIYKLIKLTYSV